jgi:O-glycosyl hydrolase
MLFMLVSLGCSAQAQSELLPGGKSILPPDALLNTPVAGLERTRATTQTVAVTGQGFERALRVLIGERASETNATQLTIQNSEPIAKGDALLASFSVRGTSSTGNKPAQMEFLFEKATSPWTKSVTSAVATRSGNEWKRVLIPFTSVDNYAPGEAMVSLRLAFSPQTLEIGGLSVVNYGTSRTAAELVALAAEKNPLGKVSATLHLNQTRQTMRGFGGNFAQPRYGATEPLDPVGEYNLKNLRVVHARIGIPLNHWAPQRGVYKDEAQAQAALLQMQMMARRKIPITGSVWEGPQWMVGGTPEQGGKTLPRERYDDCIEAVAQFLVTARDKYNAPVDYFSFNEPDYGINFKFTPAQMAEFIRLAGPRFAALGLKTKFLTADTANGSNFVEYARPLLEDKTIAPYLGPLAFHSWDVLGATDEKYTGIAALGRQYNRPVWCTEAGHDAQLWQAQNPWQSWENALRTALAYERTIRLSGAEQMDYWTYQNNYPLVSKDGQTPYPVWHVVRQMEVALPPGAKVATATTNHDDLKVLPTAGPKSGQFSVLVVNTVGPGEVTLSGLPRNAAVSVVESTTTAQAQARTQKYRTDNRGRVAIAVPARSVVTLLSSS